MQQFLDLWLLEQFSLLVDSTKKHAEYHAKNRYYSNRANCSNCIQFQVKHTFSGLRLQHYRKWVRQGLCQTGVQEIRLSWSCNTTAVEGEPDSSLCFSPSHQLDELQPSHRPSLSATSEELCNSRFNPSQIFERLGQALNITRLQTWYDSKPKDPKTHQPLSIRHPAHVFKLSSTAAARILFLWFWNNFRLSHNSRRAGDAKTQHHKLLSEETAALSWPHQASFTCSVCIGAQYSPSPIQHVAEVTGCRVEGDQDFKFKHSYSSTKCSLKIFQSIFFL